MLYSVVDFVPAPPHQVPIRSTIVPIAAGLCQPSALVLTAASASSTSCAACCSAAACCCWPPTASSAAAADRHVTLLVPLGMGCSTINLQQRQATYVCQHEPTTQFASRHVVPQPLYIGACHTRIYFWLCSSWGHHMQVTCLTPVPASKAA